MERRWFLAKVGAIIGSAFLPTLGPTKTTLENAKRIVDAADGEIVRIKDPEMVEEEGVKVLLHQIGSGPPKRDAQGFGNGAIWLDANTGIVYCNIASAQHAVWKQMDGDPEKFVSMALEHQLEPYKEKPRGLGEVQGRRGRMVRL
jgi:hypothetical protein